MKHTIPNTLLIYKRECIALAIAALIIRALVFYCYIQPHGYYKQADSGDYHIAALCLRFGFGMSKPLDRQHCDPIFWRTPGYPLFLAPWYYVHTPTTDGFEDARQAQELAIWIQILLNALLPIIMFLLALMLTNSHVIASITGWITAFHLGFVLASTYLLSEGIALIPFYLFVYFFYTALRKRNEQNTTSWYIPIIAAACMLAIYTWIRPMGQFVAIVACGIMLACAMNLFKERIKKIALFACTFMLCIAPWYVRNHTLTGHWFFCPMFGTYLNSFSAPRALSNAEKMPLLDAWKKLGTSAAVRHAELKRVYAARGLHCPIEVATSSIAWPIVYKYPVHVLIDWVRESCKTACDLYSNQLVAFVQCTYFYDPLIEYLTEKWQECVYTVPMTYTMRFIVYLEILYMLFLWIGLIAGTIYYLLLPLYKRLQVSPYIRSMFDLWINIIPLIGAIIGMTGGFGYARLRLPVEGLMLILSLTFWHQYATHMRSKKIVEG